MVRSAWGGQRGTHQALLPCSWVSFTCSHDSKWGPDLGQCTLRWERAAQEVPISIPVPSPSICQAKSPLSAGTQGRTEVSGWAIHPSCQVTILPRELGERRTTSGGLRQVPNRWGQGRETDLASEESWAVGWMEVGLPKLGVTGISLESQVTLGHRCSAPPHTQDTLWPVAQGTPLVMCDVTPNDYPDDNMNIKDKSQEPQTCSGPQGKEEGSFQSWAAPGCSHTTLPAPTPPQFCMPALPSPAILPSNSYLPLKVRPQVTSSGIVLSLTVPGSPFTALTTKCHRHLLLVCVWGMTPHPRRQVGLILPQLTSLPLTPSAWEPRNQ